MGGAGFGKVLVANRGEIARRVLRTLRRMGLASVAVYSDADEAAPHVREADEAVRIGPAPAAESYLDADRLIEAARRSGADAVHPGYGFLSENAEFAARCAEAGLCFVGPPAEAIRCMGDKAQARARMESAGVPVTPGVVCAGLDAAALAREATRIGYPVLVKAAAGGGGRGLRAVESPEALADALESAAREARGAFGDDALLLEKLVGGARHVEVQIFGDGQGNVAHLFERDCSLQRRHQKIVEEAPAPGLDAALRARLHSAAIAAGKAIGYVGAGTVEFLVDAAGDCFFLEMNTRLQVEHPVTESILSLDLVELQLRVAAGEALPFEPEALVPRGWAIEARLYAEDPARDFLPATGRLVLWAPPELPGLRIDSGVEEGSSVGVHYDPLLAKLVAHGADREQARRRLLAGLRALAVGGVATNRAFLIAALEHPAFVAGDLDTRFVERHLPPAVRAGTADPAADRFHAAAAALYEHARRRAVDGGPLPPGIPSGWRNSPSQLQRVSYVRGDARIDVGYAARPAGRFDLEIDGAPASARVAAADGRSIDLELDGVRRRVRVGGDGDRLHLHSAAGAAELLRVPRHPPSRGASAAGGCVAPMTGVVREIRVAPGDRVAAGDLLLVLEAMKMEHPIVAAEAGTVSAVHVELGQQVDPDEVLVVVEAE